MSRKSTKTPRRSRSRQTPSAGKQSQSLVVFVVSGGTGRTADQVLKAALAQFDVTQFAISVVVHASVRTVTQARRVVAQAAEKSAIVVHTLVQPRIREAVVQEADRRRVPIIDLLGPVINCLSDRLRVGPRNQPGLSYQLRKEQFDRIDSVDFTLGHDDGARTDTLSAADVVLIGVSRVAKSVTCFYLAYRGIRAANVPIVPGSSLPPELLDMDPRKVIGLTMNAERLRAIRSARLGTMGYGEVDSYVDRRQILEEVQYAAELMRKHKWKSIDVSYLSVEEVATEVLRCSASK